MTPDNWLFEHVYEPIAHHVEARFPTITNFTLARYALIPWGANGVMPIWAGVTPLSVLIVFLTIIGVGFGIYNAWRAEQQATASEVASIQRHASVFSGMRAFFMGFIFSDLVVMFLMGDLQRVPQLIADIGYLSHMYFMACERMPPGFREKIEERRAMRSGRLATVEN